MHFGGIATQEVEETRLYWLHNLGFCRVQSN